MTPHPEVPEVPEANELQIIEKYSKEGPYMYDDGAFSIWLSRYGLWRSTDRDGKGIVSSSDKESVVFWSREHLNGFQNSVSHTTGVSFESEYKL